MPKRMDIQKILVIGGGPTIIGQGSECDAHSLEAAQTLKELGYEVIYVDSNPFSITADSEYVKTGYMEPLTVDMLHRVIETEHPDAVLTSCSGQSAMNMGLLLHDMGALGGAAYLGTDPQNVRLCEEYRIQDTGQGLKSGIIDSVEAGMGLLHTIGLPAFIRPVATPGGAGSTVVYNIEEYVRALNIAMDCSAVSKVVIREAIIGWKEIHTVAARDSYGNTICIGIYEDIEPVGVHSGDSIAVWPAQTISDKVKKELRTLSEHYTEAVECIGVCEVRFAISPDGNNIVLLSVSPRPGRSCAFIGPMCDFSIAGASAGLAVGLSLHEAGIKTSMQEPAGMCAVKAARFAFKRFLDADKTLGTSMKSVGEVFAIGSRFTEALQKALRSLDIDHRVLGLSGPGTVNDITDTGKLREMLATPTPERPYYLRAALDAGFSIDDIAELTKIDRWHVEQIDQLSKFESELADRSLVGISEETLIKAKSLGYSDIQLASILETSEEQVRIRRDVLGVYPKPAALGNMKSLTYGEAASVDSKNADILIVGPGPNRIGSGAETNYSLWHSAFKTGYPVADSTPASAVIFRQSGNCWCVPTTVEDILDLKNTLNSNSLLIGYGGRLSVEFSARLKNAGAKLLGNNWISSGSSRRDFTRLVSDLGFKMPDSATASSNAEAAEKAQKLGYPVMIRSNGTHKILPIEIVYEEADLENFLDQLTEINETKPVSIDVFLEDALKVHVDAISDGSEVVICGVMEHIEQAAINSGDSACSVPPFSLSEHIVSQIKECAKGVGLGCKLNGLYNVQFAVSDSQVYVLEAMSGSSSTVPMLCKLSGTDWNAAGVQILLGHSLSEIGIDESRLDSIFGVKETVFPFSRFPGSEVILGPEMKSTGQVMGIDTTFAQAYIKAQLASGQVIPEFGNVFVSVADGDKEYLPEIGKKLIELGYSIVATRGTGRYLKENGINARIIGKIGEGRPDATDLIKNGEIDLIINTLSGKKPRLHEVTIRSAVVVGGIPIITTIAGAKETLAGLGAARKDRLSIRPLIRK